jgi:hypothetical protein
MGKNVYVKQPRLSTFAIVYRFQVAFSYFIGTPIGIIPPIEIHFFIKWKSFKFGIE